MVEEVIPDSLMKQIRELAEREGVTVEQFISSTAAEKAAAWMTVGYLWARSARGNRKNFEHALMHVPDVDVKFETPRVLGIDGVRVDGKFCIILTDIEAGLVIALLKGAKKKIIVEWLEALPDRDKIKLVLMDMCLTERAAIKAALPHSIIIVDRFHIQRMANELMDKVRIRLYSQRKSEWEPGEKRPRPEPFRMRRSKLKGRINYLKAWFKAKPELEIAYNLKEAFLEIWDDEFNEVTSATGRSIAARKRYDQWQKTIPQEKEYKPLQRNCSKIEGAIRDWGEYIFNYFDYPFTNAFTESANRRIKDDNRDLRGCSFETAQDRIIYGT
jgi:transposase